MKKIILVLKVMVFAIIASIIFGAKPQVAYADFDGDYLYKLEGNNATITQYLGKEGYVIIPSKIDGHPVTKIGNGAFESVSGMTSVTIPVGVISIESCAFINCTDLTNVSIPSSVITIKDSAFYGCENLKNITISNKVTYIGEEAFKSCRALKVMIIPNSVTYIGDGAFEGCVGMTKLSISDSIKVIGKSTFAGCINLSSIIIPNGVTTIDDYAFSECGSLKSVIIPNTIAKIGAQAFFLSNLEEARFFGNAPSMGTDVFLECPPNFKIYYLSGKTGYSNPWHGYKTQAFYGVIYNGNGNTSGNVPFDNNRYSNGSLLKVVGNTGSLSKSGYTFAGWNTKADGRGINYSTGSSLTIKNVNLNLYARWIPNPSIPLKLQVQSTGYSSIKITWGLVIGANGYEVYRSATSNGTFAKVGETTTSALVNTGLLTWTNYYYKVRSYKLIGNTKIYSNYSVIISVKPIPSTPTNLKVVRINPTSSNLTWNGVLGASGYEIYGATSSTGVYSRLKDTAALNYRGIGLAKGKKYYYKIRAYRMVGKIKIYSSFTNIVGL